MKTVRYAAEALVFYLLFIVFSLMPPERASGLGGWIGRSIGSRLASSRKAEHHLKMALPTLHDDARRKIIKNMWDNLGRVVAEYPHLERLARDYTEVSGLENIEDALKGQDSSAIVFIGAHLGNWEIAAPSSLVSLSQPIDLTFREPNNPWIAKILSCARSIQGQLTGYPKSSESGRKIIHALKNGRSIGILIDQKYNEGLDVPFFGQPAMTNPVFVQLCQKYKCPLIPVRIVRTRRCHFHLHVYPAIPVQTDAGVPLPPVEIITKAHALLEEWITEHPAQWIWMHKRWKN